MANLTAKQRILNYLTKKEGYNTFSTAQAQRLFGISNVSARIHELRKEGYAIYLNERTRRDGTKVSVYRLGSPSKSFKKYFKVIGVKAQNVA